MVLDFGVKLKKKSENESVGGEITAGDEFYPPHDVLYRPRVDLACTLTVLL